MGRAGAKGGIGMIQARMISEFTGPEEDKRGGRRGEKRGGGRKGKKKKTTLKHSNFGNFRKGGKMKKCCRFV